MERPALFTQSCSPVGIEARHMRARRANTKGERLPPLVEGRMLNADHEPRLLDVAQTGGTKQLAEVTLACSGKRGLTCNAQVQSVSCFPEDAQWSAATGEVPHARDHDTIWPRHAPHLS